MNETLLQLTAQAQKFIYVENIVSQFNAFVIIVCRYVQLNIRFSDAFRKYDSSLPTFLHNRPREFVQHVCQQWAAAQPFTNSDISASGNCVLLYTAPTLATRTLSISGSWRVCLPARVRTGIAIIGHVSTFVLVSSILATGGMIWWTVTVTVRTSVLTRTS